MEFKFHLLAVGSAAVVMLGACVDDNYSLDDIDTTTRITVDNLTLPVNIDAVTLADVITYDDDSRIKPYLYGRQRGSMPSPKAVLLSRKTYTSSM